jgi:hypothetical protein
MALCDVSLWPNALERSAAASVYFFLLYDDGIAGGTMRIAACATLVLLLSTNPSGAAGSASRSRAVWARPSKSSASSESCLRSVERFCISWPNIRD